MSKHTKSHTGHVADRRTVRNVADLPPRQVDRLVLSSTDRDFFLSLLADPPEPSAALRRAARRHAMEVRED